MRHNRFLAVLLALLLMVCQTAFAEQAYVNLEERFGDVPTYEHEGSTYYLKSRVSTVLVMCANLAQDASEGIGSAELILLLPIDDDAKRISPIQFDGGLIAGWLETQESQQTLNELFAASADAHAGAVKLVDTLNALFPEPPIEHYAMLDLRGLPQLDGIANDEVNTSGEALVERLRAIKNQAEQSGSGDLNSMLNSMSGYIITDMKSGAMMKVVDKADRYDRASRMSFPVLEKPAEGEELPEKLNADLNAFADMIVEIFYEDTRIW